MRLLNSIVELQGKFISCDRHSTPALFFIRLRQNKAGELYRVMLLVIEIGLVPRQPQFRNL